MRIDGIYVKQVVLHAPDDSAERGDIASEYAVQVHATQFMCDAGRCPKNLQKQLVIARILPELVVDQVQVALDRCDRRRADAFEFGVLLQQQEELQQCRWMLLEKCVANDLQESMMLC